MTGDSEPIGAHVDPYDPASPVRIAPEEQGEEVEVLAESVIDEKGDIVEVEPYIPAETGEELQRIGNKKYVRELEEAALDKRFQDLVGNNVIARYGYVISDGCQCHICNLSRE